MSAPRPRKAGPLQAAYDIITTSNEPGGVAAAYVAEMMPAADMAETYTRKQIDSALQRGLYRGFFQVTNAQGGKPDLFRIADTAYYEGRQAYYSKLKEGWAQPTRKHFRNYDLLEPRQEVAPAGRGSTGSFLLGFALGVFSMVIVSSLLL